MGNDEYEEILAVLLADLQKAFEHSKAKHAVQAAQKAYIKAAQRHRDFERQRQMKQPIQTS